MVQFCLLLNSTQIMTVYTLFQGLIEMVLKVWLLECFKRVVASVLKVWLLEC